MPASAAACANSDGITGYTFSHKGLWKGGVDAGRSPSAKACAAVCSADPKCVAFHYYSAGTTGCFKYFKGHGAAVNNNNLDTAYTRCSAGTCMHMRMHTCMHTRMHSHAHAHICLHACS